MSWLDEHRRSEFLASGAEMAAREGDGVLARELYSQAAAAEERALAEVGAGRPRTYGVTAVSAVSLLFKSGQREAAVALAGRCLGVPWLPGFARRQLGELVLTVRAQACGGLSDGGG